VAGGGLVLGGLAFEHLRFACCVLVLLVTLSVGLPMTSCHVPLQQNASLMLSFIDRVCCSCLMQLDPKSKG
jgi:hypothetical protein